MQNQIQIRSKIVSVYSWRIRMWENGRILTTPKFEFCHHTHAYFIMPAPGQTGCCSQLSICLSFHPFVRVSVPHLFHNQTFKHENKWTDWDAYQQKWFTGQGHGTINFADQKTRPWSTETGHKNPFRWDISEIIRWIITNLTGTYYGKCPLCLNRGQRSRSREAKDRFRSIILDSFESSSFSSLLQKLNKCKTLPNKL